MYRLLALIGKEIMWFHTVYWPAMLFALGLPVPKQVYAHGWWLADGTRPSPQDDRETPRERGVEVGIGVDDARWPGVPLIVFPGNVGSPAALAEALAKVRG